MNASVDKKKLVIILAVVVAVILILVLLMILGNKPKKTSEYDEPKNATIELPYGETQPMEESKTKAYTSDYYENNGRSSKSGDSSIDEYFKRIAGEQGVDDPLKELTGKPDSGKEYKEVTMDDLFAPPADLQEKESSKRRQYKSRREQEEESSSKYIDDYFEAYERHLDRRTAEHSSSASSSSNQERNSGNESHEEEVVEVREKISINDVAVRKNGSVSSMDDGFNSVGVSGLSSLDGDSETVFVDDSYPFKCMFVRESKIKSGDRVPVRLLEDMVIGGQLVPKNTHLMASCTLGDRLDMTISSIEVGGRILNLDYDAYDASDHTRGIFCPQVDESTKNRVKSQGLNMGMTMARSELGRYAQDIVQAGQLILNNTGRERYVIVPEGYQFYIVKSKKR